MSGLDGDAVLSAPGHAGAHTSITAAMSGLVVFASAQGTVVEHGVPAWRFPNAARTLAGVLIGYGLIAAGYVGTDTPADLQNKLPFVRIGRVGGNSDLVNDYPIVDVDVFAATSVAAESLAEYIRQFLTLPSPPPLIDGHGLIDRVEVTTGPQQLPWADTKVRRYGATYRLTTRRYPVSLG